jgi:hypothetical protein
VGSPVELIEVGDYVRVEPTPDVWTVVRIDGSSALLSPSSIALAGRPRRVAKVTTLTVVRGVRDPDDEF